MPYPSTRSNLKTFKREAVQNWMNGGKSAAVIADELSLTANLLYNWKKLFAPDAVGGGRAAAGANPGSAADLQSQLDAARRELRHLREHATLAGLLLPTLSKAKTKAQIIRCNSNLKRLQPVWHQYVPENNDVLPPKQ